MPAPRTIDEYLAAVREDQRAVLQKLRQTIQAAVPQAEECISYGLAAFRLNGKPLVAFGASARHCAFYPMNATTVAAYHQELQGYDTSKGTIRFPAAKPLPVSLVRKLVKARIAENAGKPGTARPTKKQPERAAAQHVEEVVARLRRLGTKATREGMARYGLPSDKAFGVPVGTLQQVAKELGRDHDLAAALWATGWYEARMLAAFIDEPERVTPAQMDRWCKEFDNWGICDTVCFHLFDRSPHAFRKVVQWARLRGEFARRGSFALLACLALHDKAAPEEAFTSCLPLIEQAATDERNFVKKAVSWALRAVGRRNAALHEQAVTLAQRLVDSAEAAARWVGKDVLKELTHPKVTRRF